MFIREMSLLLVLLVGATQTEEPIMSASQTCPVSLNCPLLTALKLRCCAAGGCCKKREGWHECATKCSKGGRASLCCDGAYCCEPDPHDDGGERKWWTDYVIYITSLALLVVVIGWVSSCCYTVATRKSHALAQQQQQEEQMAYLASAQQILYATNNAEQQARQQPERSPSTMIMTPYGPMIMTIGSHHDLQDFHASAPHMYTNPPPPYSPPGSAHTSATGSVTNVTVPAASRVVIDTRIHRTSV